MIEPEEVARAYERIHPWLAHTPLLRSSRLEGWLGGHTLIFKAENMQRIGAFKARGALNTLLKRKEEGALPESVVAFSLGNHSMGVAWACHTLGIPCTIFLQSGASPLKKQGTESYGAEVVMTASREEAADRVKEKQAEGYYFIHPYDHDDIIAGQGTAALEAFKDGVQPDAIFTPIGGGGLAGGSWLTTQLVSPQTEVFGVEPVLANDAARSVQAGEIVGYDTPPPTIADGVRTLSLTERTFEYIRQLAGLYEVEERDIIYWTQWLTHLLKTTVEPSGALPMAAAAQWLSAQTTPKTVLMVLSGGNVDAITHRQIWAEDRLTKRPAL